MSKLRENIFWYIGVGAQSSNIVKYFEGSNAETESDLSNNYLCQSPSDWDQHQILSAL